jgi:cell division protein FtsI (penicillin-binding protein 3)
VNLPPLPPGHRRRPSSSGAGRPNGPPRAANKGHNAHNERWTRGPAGRRAAPATATRNPWRYAGLLAALAACLAGILVQLVRLQAVGSAKYVADANSEYVHEVSFLGERGAILDLNGFELAMSVPMTTVYADPYQVTNPRAEAEALAGPLGEPEGSLQADLSEASGFVYLAHTVPGAVAAKVEKLVNSGSLPGIYTMQQPKRFYPAGQLAAPLLGIVGTDGAGLSGLEYEYNGLLEGKPGKLVEDMDPAGGEIPGGLQQYEAPVRGDDLVLTIDEPLQYDAEEALARAIVAAQAQSGMALIMDSKTGALLAVAELTMPSAATSGEPPALPVWFVPQSLSGAPEKLSQTALRRAQPVESPTASAFTNVYEPGSVEKLVTFSAALQSGAISPSTAFQVPNTYNVAGTYISDAWVHPTLDWTASNIIAHSSDIGTVEIAQRMGLPTLLSYVKGFGIGEPTAVHFPGESAGLVPFSPSQWSGTTIATVPIGQGIAVTAIQMLDAYNTIANGGLLVAPRLVNGYVDADGREHLFPKPPARRVVSKVVAAEMTQMLEGVVSVGTGQAAQLEPYTVAGKTGTALYPKPGGGYFSNYFISSFAGFVPAEDPAITAMVVVIGTHQYGAEASAPVFATLARDALERLGVPPAKHRPPLASVPPATPYGGEGEAAGPALPGLTGTPDVRVEGSAATAGTGSAGAAGGAQAGAAHAGATSSRRAGPGH